MWSSSFGLQQMNCLYIFQIILNYIILHSNKEISSDYKLKSRFFFIMQISNSKWNLMFYKIELITRQKNSNKTFRINNWKCYVVLHISIL